MATKPPTSIPAICEKVTVPFSQTLIATLDNSFDIKHALLNGSVPFHEHPENDEAFYILSGKLVIEVLDSGNAENRVGDAAKKAVEMKVGDLFVVPKGVYHRPIGEQAHVLILEGKGIPGGNGQFAKTI